MSLYFLAPREMFEAYASMIGVQPDSDAPLAADALDDGEVGIEGDTGKILETTAIDRWRSFFAWLGVCRGLRLCTSTMLMTPAPAGRAREGSGGPVDGAFAGLDKIWTEFRAQLEQDLSADPRWATTDHYLCQVHNLDRLDEIVAVARLTDNDVAEMLLGHLVRNWPSYARHTRPMLALVSASKSPAARRPPPRATRISLPQRARTCGYSA